MIQLNRALLDELGLGTLPEHEKDGFLKHIYETLEMRVGTRLASGMSEAQLVEFEQYIQQNDEQGAFHWLEANFPDYKQVVAGEFQTLKTEIQGVAGDILAASTANAAASAGQVGPDQAGQLPPAQ